MEYRGSGDFCITFGLQAVTDFVQVDKEAIHKGQNDQNYDTGDDERVKVAGFYFGHGRSAHGGAAPRHNVHHGVRAAHDGQQCFLAEA